mgnify:CR=1 FL=1
MYYSIILFTVNKVRLYDLTSREQSPGGLDDILVLLVLPDYLDINWMVEL